MLLPDVSAFSSHWYDICTTFILGKRLGCPGFFQIRSLKIWRQVTYIHSQQINRQCLKEKLSWSIIWNIKDVLLMWYYGILIIVYIRISTVITICLSDFFIIVFVWKQKLLACNVISNIITSLFVKWITLIIQVNILLKLSFLRVQL